MSALREAAAELNRDPNAAAVFLTLIGPAAWRWYDAHRKDRILKVKVAVFSVTILVQDVRSVFVMAFGEPSLSAGREMIR